MNGEQNNGKHKGGRNLKKNPSIHRYVFRLTDEENAKFLSLFEASVQIIKPILLLPFCLKSKSKQ